MNLYDARHVCMLGVKKASRIENPILGCYRLIVIYEYGPPPVGLVALGLSKSFIRI